MSAKILGAGSGRAWTDDRHVSDMFNTLSIALWILLEVRTFRYVIRLRGRNVVEGILKSMTLP